MAANCSKTSKTHETWLKRIISVTNNVANNGEVVSVALANNKRRQLSQKKKARPR